MLARLAFLHTEIWNEKIYFLGDSLLRTTRDYINHHLAPLILPDQ